MKTKLILVVLITIFVAAVAPAGSTARADWTVTNLHVSYGSESSWALGVSDGQQVGVANVLLGPGESRRTASLWTGTAASWIDLHPADLCIGCRLPKAWEAGSKWVPCKSLSMVTLQCGAAPPPRLWISIPRVRRIRRPVP